MNDYPCWEYVEVTGDVPQSRSGHTCALHKNRFLFVFGGFDGSSCFDDLYCLDLENPSWRKCSPGGDLPSGRASHSAVTDEFAGAMYIFGGSGSHFGYTNKRDLYEFDFETEIWTLLSNPRDDTPSARYGQSMVQYKEGLYVWGGTHGTNYPTDMHRFDLCSKQWEFVVTMGDLPCGRYRHQAMVKGDTMYVVGGSGINRYGDVFLFRFDTNLWTKMITTGADLSDGRYAHSTVLKGNSIYLYGGNDGVRHDDLLQLDLETKVWSRVQIQGLTPPGRDFHAAVLRDDSMVIFGGSSGMRRHNDTYDFRLSARVPPCTLSSDMATLLDKSQTEEHWQAACDVYLVPKGSNGTVTGILCHSHIIIVRCPHLAIRLPRQDHNLIPHLIPDGNSYGSTYPANPGGIQPCHQAAMQYPQGNRNGWTHCGVPMPPLPPPSGALPPVAHNHLSLSPASPSSMTSYPIEYPGSPNSSSVVPMSHAPSIMSPQNDVTIDSLFQEVVGSQQAAGTMSVQQMPVSPAEAYPTDSVYSTAPGPIHTMGALPEPQPPPLAEHPVVLKPPAPRCTIEMAEEKHILWHFIYFLYTEEVMFGKLTVEQLFRLFMIASEHQTHRLAALCERQLKLRMSLENIMVLLNLSTTSGSRAHPIMEACKHFFLINYNQCAELEDCERLDPKLLCELMRLHNQRIQPASMGTKGQWGNFIGNVGQKSILLATTIPPKSIQQDFRRLLDEQIGCDFTIQVQGETIPVHRAILIARCNYFASCLLTSGMVEARTHKLVIPAGTSMTAPAFRAFLQFIYAGVLHTPNEAHTAMYLIDASAFYGLTNTRLKYYCETCVKNSFNEAHVLQLFEASSSLEVEAVRAMALDFIVKNFDKVGNQPALYELDKSLLVEILRGLAAKGESAKPVSLG